MKRKKWLHVAAAGTLFTMSLPLAVWSPTIANAAVLPETTANKHILTGPQVDELADTNLTWYTYNLKQTPEDPYYGEDKSSYIRDLKTETEGKMIYASSVAIKDVQVTTHAYEKAKLDSVRFEYSLDGTTFFAIPTDKVTRHYVGSHVKDWQKFSYHISPLPENARYFKIIIVGDPQATTSNTAISKVVINKAVAPVQIAPTNEIFDGTTVNVNLTSTPGASISYRLLPNETYIPYTSPLVIDKAVMIEAIAKTPGLEPSLPRTFRLVPRSSLKVDKFGQSYTASFPAEDPLLKKVMNEKELADDANSDKSYYSDATLPKPKNRDLYGGWVGSNTKYGLAANGYFSIQHINKNPDNPVLTTPDGNVFFSLGVNGLSRGDTFTEVYKNGEDLDFKLGLEDLPKMWEIPGATAYNYDSVKQIKTFSYYSWNEYRKFKQTDGTYTVGGNEDFYKRAVDRIQRWGFNSSGGWGLGFAASNKLPYTSMLDLLNYNIGGTKIDALKVFDIYALDETIAGEAGKTAKQALEDKIKAAVDPKQYNTETDQTKVEDKLQDKYLIGYFIGNEYKYDDFFRVVSTLTPTTGQPAYIKKAFVKYVKHEYEKTVTDPNTTPLNEFKKNWNLTGNPSITSFDQLVSISFARPDNAATLADIGGFYKEYLDKFYGTVSGIFRTYDSNHLLLGDRWLMDVITHKHPTVDFRARYALAAAQGKYMDVISLNYYTNDLNETFLNEVYRNSGKKPILISEFSFSTLEYGFKDFTNKTIPTGNEEGSQTTRRDRYIDYVNSAAGLGFVVGAHWFSYLDQPLTTRANDNESYSVGLLNVADRPYKTFLQGVTKTNHDIYNVLKATKTP
ncbi:MULTISPECIES: hypothetical protein [Paenibacillus]|uniref:hypothetical protein n=1 Tax=Paenibacillus TaxID=44249 RepID=UPI0022B8BD24|nr:hypothetical protein [Paenibacillus caseinilyticus]MCZ8521395.1 hypothetical protein [Paenibacillus caseinilyticus]